MFEAVIKETEPMTVAVLAMRGPYDQIPEGYGRLYGWIAQHGLEPVGMPQAVYLTAPDQVPESDALWELWAPVAGEAEIAADEEGVGTRRLPAMTVASTMHKGPYETIAPTYTALASWVSERGYAMAGPPREVYYSDPDVVQPQDYLTEIVFPVAKM